MTKVSVEQMSAIVHDGITFIRSITSIYGPEKGMELWETIANTLDPDIKGKIFFAMITGDHDGIINLVGTTFGSNKIACIKTIRQSTGMALIDAKNAYETVANYGQQVSINIGNNDRNAIISDLRQNGMVVS